ncbi:MAG: hypothetical protein AAFS01_10670 [Pseudomonadota bacterium]
MPFNQNPEFSIEEPYDPSSRYRVFISGADNFAGAIVDGEFVIFNALNPSNTNVPLDPLPSEIEITSRVGVGSTITLMVMDWGVKANAAAEIRWGSSLENSRQVDIGGPTKMEFLLRYGIFRLV